MKKRYASLGALILVASCKGEVLDVGNGASGPDGGGSGESTPGSTSGSCDAATYGGTPSDGTGYSAYTPAACSAADGTVEPFLSQAQAAQAVVGTWFDCGASGTSVLKALGGGASADGIAGLQLTSDGHFLLLGVPLGVAVSTAATATLIASTGVGADGGANGTPITGTYAVTDASATLGAGAYQINFQASGGGVFVAQVLLLASPTKLRFVFSTGPNTEEFAPPVPLKFRAPTCSYGQFGPTYAPASDADAAARLTGSWLWCAGDPPSVPNQAREAVVGLVFSADGTWTALVEDDAGNVARGVATGDNGTFTLHGTSLEIVSSVGDGTVMNVATGACEPLLGLSGETPTPPLDEWAILQRSATSY